jgi:hypothetical protein
MANLINTNGFVSNPQFSGGEAITPLSGAAFDYANQGYGGLYVGTAGTLVVKTINGNVLTLVSASGFIPGIIGAVSASSTAADIIGFDPKPVSFPTTTTSTSTTSTSTSTTAAPTTTSTTTAAPQFTAITLYSGSYTGTPGSATLTGPGSVCNLAQGPGFPGPVSASLFVTSSITFWGPLGPATIQAYTDSALTTLYTGGDFADFNAWGAPLTFPLTGGGVVRFFDKTLNGFVTASNC